MPNVGSWNGHWSGEGVVYAQTRRITSKAILDRIFKGKSEAAFPYDFGDGWRASVNVSSIPAAEATKLMKRSQGFRGYDWMIAEIINYGYIRPLERSLHAHI
jgi:hypothetical protein